MSNLYHCHVNYFYLCVFSYSSRHGTKALNSSPITLLLRTVRSIHSSTPASTAISVEVNTVYTFTPYTLVQLFISLVIFNLRDGSLIIMILIDAILMDFLYFLFFYSAFKSLLRCRLGTPRPRYYYAVAEHLRIEESYESRSTTLVTKIWGTENDSGTRVE